MSQPVADGVAQFAFACLGDPYVVIPASAATPKYNSFPFAVEGEVYNDGSVGLSANSQQQPIVMICM
jgi:hypothetical protein